MGARRALPYAVALILVMLGTSVAPTAGQGSEGHLSVATDYELFGTSDLQGGGHVTWTWTGGQAADFRRRLLYLYDGYPIIPQGFPNGGAATNGNENGRLEAVEGVVYTNFLEAAMEASGRGTDAHYAQLYPFDLRDKSTDEPSGFARSTSGLVDTDASATGSVELRFLFQAKTTTADGRVFLASRSLVDPLYDLFSYRIDQSPNLQPSGLYPEAWPFQVGSGWAVVQHLGERALWAGNTTTGFYDNDTDASTETFADPAFASLPQYEPFDFRFASRASATFNYSGSLAVGDTFHLEYANSPAYASWTALPFGVGADLPPAPGGWTTASVDLTPLLGQQAKLRLHFVSNATGSDVGLFVRNFAIDAPAVYAGEVVQSDTHYLIGTLSFSDPGIASGGIHLIRTPGGELLTYAATWSGSAPPADTIYFRTFEVTENPQILFAVMIGATIAISRLQERAFQRYREAHPTVYRPAVPRTRWLHRSGKVAMGLLVLFYFVPTALWVVGLRFVVTGPVYWFLALTAALLLGFGTRAHYRQRLERAPPSVLGEEGPVVRKVVLPGPEAVGGAVVGTCAHCGRAIREGEPGYTCSCGAAYHANCASGLARCANCRKRIAAGIQTEWKAVSLRCDSCGELQTVAEGTDPRAATCPACGGRLRHLESGKRYLVVARHPAVAFAWIKDLMAGGKPALCLTPAAPDRLRLEFGVKDVTIVQVSARAPSAGIDPRRLDPVGLRAILPLAREGRGGVILYDGIDQTIAESSLSDVIRFLRKANDMAFVHGITVIARVAPRRISQADLKRLNSEFDEFLDLSAQP